MQIFQVCVSTVSLNWVTVYFKKKNTQLRSDALFGTPWHHLRMAAPVLLAITHREPPTVHHDGMSLKKIIWKIKAKTTSMVFINATGPAFSIWRAFARNIWPPKPNIPISMRNSLSNPQCGRRHSPKIERTMTHSMRPTIT